MKMIGIPIVGIAFLVSGLQLPDAQAQIGITQIGNQFTAGGSELVIRVHNSCHDDCQKDVAWHKHKGMQCKRVSCPSGRNRSQTPPAQSDGSLINLSPRPSSEKVQQQSH